jgi:adenosylcobyric acid synthase
MKITIGHFYPDLLNLYGDRGNILAIKKRCEWRGIETEVKEFSIDDEVDFSGLDIVFLGGGSDREQLIVCKRLKEIQKDILDYVQDNGVILAVCGGYQLLGHYYQLEKEKIEGLSVLDIYTIAGQKRLIDNVILETDFGSVTGFENHGGRTYIGDHKPLGKVLYGNGNNGEDEQEGVLYRNVFGTYLHGPILPKNPNLTDELIARALTRKYGTAALSPLDDCIEIQAKEYIIERFLKEKS